MLTLVVVITLFNSCSGFYVPGVAPVEFADGDEVKVYAVKMTSVITQLPYDYYSLPFCGQATSKWREGVGVIGVVSNVLVVFIQFFRELMTNVSVFVHDEIYL